MAFELFSQVVLREDFPEYNLKRGTVATVIEHHPSQKGEDSYSLEVFNADEITAALLVATESQIELSVSLPSEWRTLPLAKVCNGTPQNGAFIKNPKWGAGTPYVNVRDTYQNVIVKLDEVERLHCDANTLKTYALRENDILFVRSSLKREGIGQCCLIRGLTEPTIFDCHLIRVSPDPEVVDSLFLTYLFLSESGKRDLIARSKTTTMTTINQKTLMSSLATFPSITEQKAIAQTLQSIQQAKEARQRELTLERERKAALMQYLFTYGTRGERQKLTEVGAIPETWKVLPLEEVAKIERGKFTHRPRNDPDFYGGDIPFIQTGDVTLSNGYIKRYSQTLNEKGLTVSRIFPAGTIVITIAANIGYTGILEFDSAFPDSLIGITPSENFDNSYLNYYLSTQQKEMDRKAPQGTQKNINIEFLRPWPIISPSLEEQILISKSLQACDRKITALEDEVTVLNQLFCAALEELMTGRQKIPC